MTRLLVFSLYALILCGISTTGLWGQDIPAEKIYSVNWADELHGAVRGPRLLLALAGTPTDIAPLLDKQYGIRLSNVDPAHALVYAAGPLPVGVRVELTRAWLDRLQQKAYLDVALITPERLAADAKVAAEAQARRERLPEALTTGELQIGPAKPQAARPLPIERPATVKPHFDVGEPGQNPAFFMPVGRLDAGRWEIHVRATTLTEHGEKSLDTVVSYLVKDLLPGQEGGKDANTPALGLGSLPPPRGTGYNLGGGL